MMHLRTPLVGMTWTLIALTVGMGVLLVRLLAL